MHNENIEQLKLNVRSVRRSFVEKLIWLDIQVASSFTFYRYIFDYY